MNGTASRGRGTKRHIIAMGGGGFSDGRRGRGLDEYVVAQSKNDRPRVCFIPTASGDAQVYIDRFYRAFANLGARPTHLTLFMPQKTRLGIADFLAGQDIIYIGGGNTRNLLILWKAWDLVTALKRAYESGVIIAGISAGALCWFQSGLTDSYPGRLTALKGLGWLRGSFCPHFDSEPKRKPIYRRLIDSGELPGGYAVDDGVALHFVNEEFSSAVRARKNAAARHIRKSRGRIVEVVLNIAAAE
jgi:dipeptidase E